MWVRVAAASVRRLPFGRYRLANALGRYGRTPFLARLPRDLGGFTFLCDLGDGIAREVCFTGRYEPQATQIVAALVRRGDTVVDVGANWGYFTLAAAHWTGARGRVVALEPEPRLFEILHENVNANHLSHVTVRRAAAGAADSSASFVAYAQDDENRGVSRVAAAGERVDFQADLVRVDAVLDDEQVGIVRLVKIDIEGGEYDALRGMTAGLSRGRYEYVLLECHPALLAARGVSLDATLAPLVAAHYTLHEILQSPDLYRQSARGRVPLPALLRPFRADVPLGPWPHLLAVAPSAAVPC